MAAAMAGGGADEAPRVEVPLQSSGPMIKVLCDPADARLDVLFFHGLQLGAYEDAWRTTWESDVDGEKRKVLWPREWLGAEIKDARVMSVCYDTRARGVLTFDSIGEQLVDTIKEHKLGHERPIILVGHSLGGLALKQMCVRAFKMADRQPHLSDFCRNVAGAFFYATPHIGSRLAWPGSLVFHGPVMGLLRTYDRQAARLNFDFYQRFKRLELQCVYETRPIAFLRWVPFLRHIIVVEEASAMCGMDDILGLNEDHFSICKPRDRKNQAYTRLKSYISSSRQAFEQAGGGPAVLATVSALVRKQSFEKQFNREVFPMVEAVEKIKVEIEAGGRVWPDSLFLPVPGPDGSLLAPVTEDVRKELFQYMRDVGAFWKSVRDAVAPKEGAPMLPPKVLFEGGNWAGRAQNYRLLFEPLDIANWYYRGKNADGYGHYADGIANACEDDNRKRPGRYLVLQKQERRVFDKEPRSSLGAAERLKNRLGERRWQDVVAAEGSGSA